MEWREVFWITFSVIIITNVGYIFMGSGEVQPWNGNSTEGEDETMNSDANNGKNIANIIVLYNFHK